MDEVLLWVLAAILAKGHILMEDIPGVGKTTMALAFSKVLGLECNRVQFTPDILPSDVTGYSVLQQGTGNMIYQPGAVLCNLFLADELNRATSRTQSALLKAMEEGQVTVDGVSHKIPRPFVVMATQNPTGAAGTQLLPDSQMEYYLDEVGWVILEATASVMWDDMYPNNVVQTIPSAPVETSPQETAAPTTKPNSKPTAPQETKPTPPNNGTGQLNDPPTGSPVVLSWIVAMLSVPLVIVAQWLFRRNLKKKRFMRDSPNRRALYRYREANRIAAVTKLYVPVQLDDLANKAKFSQHMLTSDELKIFSDCLQEQVKSMRQSPWYRQLVYRLIFAFY